MACSIYDIRIVAKNITLDWYTGIVAGLPKIRHMNFHGIGKTKFCERKICQNFPAISQAKNGIKKELKNKITLPRDVARIQKGGDFVTIVGQNVCKMEIQTVCIYESELIEWFFSRKKCHHRLVVCPASIYFSASTSFKLWNNCPSLQIFYPPPWPNKWTVPKAVAYNGDKTKQVSWI